MLEKIKELLEGAAAPVMFFADAWQWETIKGQMTSVVGDLRPESLTVSRSWHGVAADAYARQIKPQSDAAAKVATTMDKMATSLGICAAAGLAFYVALGVILVKFIAATITAVAALGSVVFSWAGAALIVEEAGVNTGMIIAAVAALMALLGVQANQMITLRSELVDQSAFPDGHWPNATSGQFADATVTDGDADWSLVK